jgi:sugar O-acyltransferase (sialic acid O-acetyltransferase NeuD family)
MDSFQRIVVIGAGGQARDTAWLLRELAEAGVRVQFAGFVVSDLAKLGPHDSTDGLRGDYAWLEAHAQEIDGLALGIGTPSARQRVAKELSSAFPRLEWPSLIHPRAIFERSSARLGQGTMVGAGVLGSVNLSLGDFTLINLGVTLGHEASLGTACVVNHAASISGGVSIGDAVLVGTGARILQYVRVEDCATVGAGAVVTKNVVGGVTVVGVPARPMQRASS